MTTEALSLSDILITKGACHLRNTYPSDIAAAIIYFTRKKIFSQKKIEAIVWPDELVIMTRCTEEKIKSLIKNPLEVSDCKTPSTHITSAPQTAAADIQLSGKSDTVDDNFDKMAQTRIAESQTLKDLKKDPSPLKAVN